MARVSIEDFAFDDSRYRTLGRLIKESHWAALCRMARLWLECTLRSTYVLEREVILDIHPDKKGFADAILRANLGEETEEGNIRFKGTSGRVEWLGRLRAMGPRGEAGKVHGLKGGRPSKRQKMSGDYNPLQGVSENPQEGDKNNPQQGVSENPQQGLKKTPLLTPGSKDIINNKPVPYVTLQGEEDPASGEDPGRAPYTESEIDQEIKAIKGLLACNFIPVPANGAIASRVRKGARLEDAVKAVRRWPEIKKSRRMDDEAGFWVTIFESEWWHRVTVEE